MKLQNKLFIKHWIFAFGRFFPLLIGTLLAMFLIFGCVTQKKCNEKYPCVASSDTIKTTVVEWQYRDTIITKEVKLTDSSYYKAYLKCDSLGRITITKYNDKLGKYITENAILKNNVLTVDCSLNYEDSLKIAVALKDKIIIEKEQIKVTPTQRIIKEQTAFQRFFFICGLIAWAVIITLVAVKFVKPKV